MKYLGNASLGVHHFVIAPDTSSSGASLDRLVGQMFHQTMKEVTLQGTNISPQNGILKMMFLFPRWDMLIPWRSHRIYVIDVFFCWLKRWRFFDQLDEEKTDFYVLCV